MAENTSRNKSTNNRVSSKKKRKQGRRVVLLISGLFLPLLAIYLLLAFYYQNHFYNNTVINGVTTSNMTVSEVEEAINNEVDTYQLTLLGKEGMTDTIRGEDIELHVVLDGSITELLKKQNGLSWTAAMFKTKELNISSMLTYNEELLEKIFNKLKFFDKDVNIKPENASISKYGANGYEVIPEKHGARVKKKKLLEAVQNAVKTLEPSLSIEELGAYEEPKIIANNEELQNAVNEMNLIASTAITYKFGKDTELLDGNIISEWLSVDDEYKVNLDENRIKEYVDYIGKTYNSFGRVRKFKTSYGDELKIEGGDYGWWLDRVTEVKELTELIYNGEQTVKKPVYFQTAQQYGKDDIGNTYVEVNLTAQHLFYYVDGKLILETDFVSGNLAKEYGTPVGTYPVQYKERNATLVGEDYETPVKYWMPFNRNIGFHDAPWRKEFGKDIYLTKGSHGCINMPPAAAKIMFEHIERGVAVVVYELPGTENYEVKEPVKNTEQKKDEKKEQKKDVKVETEKQAEDQTTSEQ
jgi:hypothetical protein